MKTYPFLALRSALLPLCLVALIFLQACRTNTPDTPSANIPTPPPQIDNSAPKPVEKKNSGPRVVKASVERICVSNDRLRKESWRDDDDDEDDGDIDSVCFDSQGNPFIASSDNGLAYLDADLKWQLKLFEFEGYHGTESEGPITLAHAPDGSIWMGVSIGGPFVKYKEGSFEII